MLTKEEFEQAWNKHKSTDDRKVTIKPHFIWGRKRMTFRADYYIYYMYDYGRTVTFYYRHKFMINVHIDEIERID